jgi:RNA polymerase sigma factor (sigma-70 family)
MAAPWPEFLERFDSVLSRPRRSWSPEERDAVWVQLHQGPVGKSLQGYVSRAVRDEADAEEVLYDFVFKIARDKTYDPGSRGASAFKSWRYCCLYHHLIRYFKERKRAPRLPTGETTPGGDESDIPDPSNAEREALVRLDAQKLLNSLPPKMREVLIRDMNGESGAAIASSIGTSPGYVRQIIHDARDRLRKRFPRSSE